MSHFHTPSLGDEEFELNNNFPLDIEPLGSMSEPLPNYNGLNIQDSDIINGTHDSYIKIEQIFKPELIEPKKPVLAYAAFFRDTQNAIKGQNPNASFDEVSKIVASMWQALDQNRKELYIRNAEIEKRDYIQKLNEYKINSAADTSSTAMLLPKQEPQEQNCLINLNDLNDIPIASKPALFCVNKPETDMNSFNLATLSQLTDNLWEQQSLLDESENSVPNLCESKLLEENSTSINKCIRDECTNSATINPDWEDEYCSNDCVVTHCRDVFSKWMQNRRNINMKNITLT